MKKIFLAIFLTGFILAAHAQTDQKKKLEQRKAQIQKEIREFRELLSRENKKEKSVLSKISDNNAKIKLSERLINNTQKQTKILTDEIYLNQLKINKLKRELKVLKEDYANMIVKAYKNRSQQSRIMFILSSESFLQAYKRMQYMKQYASFRKIQGEEIKSKMAELEKISNTLNAQKAEKVQLLAETEKERESLEQEKQEQEKLIKSIQKDKKRITSDIKKRQAEERDIERKIDKLIKEAIAAANKKATGTTKSTKATSTAAPNKIVLTKEGKIIADNFKANKGRLSWPVEYGYISMHYGTQPHPVIRTLEIHHSWTEITTKPGASARSIYDGEVMSVQIISGTVSVLIQHGDYITVYHNLSSVSVREGDKVSRNQNIGKVFTNPNTGKTYIKFMILQNTTYLNPEQWITTM
ncbi:murein hydrolase activator EnvC [Flavobacterium sp. MK4S-17]|uniref:murein hydrolase activator EnvC family protein n=1 Tax=Flavobacterium sp. MK4S-17 TaxID=2543737 RepID=UPI001359A728|nr:peptidoglycan DD-metalloendopeptidase family protein [Flavobacterium sp. MK4S-17]